MEEKILEMQERMTDDCKNCPYKNKCNNQCAEEKLIFNPNLLKYLPKSSKRKIKSDR